MTPSPLAQAKILVVGDGPVARALAAALAHADLEVARWWRRQGPVPSLPSLVLLAVRDEAIAEVATRLMARATEPPVLLHCAGALAGGEPFESLRPPPAGAAVMHPLRALAGRAGDADFTGVIFGVEGDAAGVAAATALVTRLGGHPLRVGAAELARYHAAAALVSNHTVGLVDAGVELLEAAGLSRAQATRALAELLGSTANNLTTLGLPAALTGPIARGEGKVVARHLEALTAWPEIDALYRATAKRVLKLAEEKGHASGAALLRVAALLGVRD